MKAELRIGNKIHSVLQTSEGELKSIVTISCLHMNVAETDEGTWQYSQLTGIRITDQLLTDSGFTKYNEAFWKKGKSDGWFLNSDGEITKSLSQHYVRCRYYHNLQNLWFALTGEELTPNKTDKK